MSDVRTALLALAGGVCALLGGWLDHALGIHAWLGLTHVPHEALVGYDWPSALALSLAVLGGVLGGAQLLSGWRAGGRALVSAGAAGATASALLLQVAGVHNPGCGLPGLVRAGAALQLAALALALTGKAPRPARGGTGAGALALSGPLALAFLAFVFRSSLSEASCFAQVPVPSALEFAPGARDRSLAFGPDGRFRVETFGGSLRVVSGSGSGSGSVSAVSGSVLLASPSSAGASDSAFVVAALRGSFEAPNEHEMGLYEFRDLATVFSVRQVVQSVEPDTSGGVVVRGALEFASEPEAAAAPVGFSLELSASEGDLVEFALRTSSPVARLYLRQQSSREEAVYGMGLQYTFSDLKGGCVPVFTVEQGIGRGIQPLSWLVNLFVPHASGSWQGSYAPAPYYLTSLRRALFLRSHAFALFDFSAPERISVEVNASAVSGALVWRDSPLGIVETYTRAHAGRMRPLPDWVGAGAIVGLQGGTAKVRAHVSTLRRAGVPLAALWLQDWTGKRETDFGRRLQWNWRASERHYPGWFELIRELARDRVYVLSYINAYLANHGGRSNESTALFHKALELDCLVKEADGRTVQIQASATPDFTYGTVDITDPRCQRWYVDEVIHANMFAGSTSLEDVRGVLGFMADFAESVSLGARFHAGEGSELHNAFPLRWAQTCRQAIDKDAFLRDNAVFFTRAAAAQSPGATTLMWMGDQMATFDHYDGLRSALNGVLSGGLSGFSLSHSDIGGYTMFNRFGGAFKVLRNAELFQRWAEMSAFSDAVFRTHEGVLPDDSVQAVDPAVSAHFATFARLHMALFAAVKRPLMAEAALTGAPLARHMMLHYPDDDSARRAKDQFMLGADLLVCPVVHEHHTGRSCYVPEGGWTHVLTGETPAPGADFWCHAPIGRPCVLYRPTDKAAAVAAVIRLTLAP